MKKAIILILAIAVIISCAACGGNEKKLVGYWENAGGNGFSNFTLNSDGTGNIGSSEKGSFHWGVKGDLLIMESDFGIDDISDVYTYKLSDNALTLTSSDGTVYRYKK